MLKNLYMFNQNRIYRVFQLINFLRTKPSKTPRSLGGLLEISERSVYRYFDLIGQSVLHKVGHYTEHQVAARNIYDANLGKIIEQLSIAIQEKKQVMLVKYFSARSETVTDRLVEPTQFTDNYEAISAFEVSTEQNKYFNIERISEVRLLDSDMFFEDQHEFFKPDVFGFQGKEMDKEVEFEM